MDVGLFMSDASAVISLSSTSDNVYAFRALTLLDRHEEEHPSCIILTDEVQAWLSVWSKVQMI